MLIEDQIREIRQINPVSAYEAAQHGVLFLDVREPEEIEETAYDVPEILCIPLSNFGQNYAGIPKDREVIVVCRRGVRSMKVASFLVSEGWSKELIFNLEGGIYAWEDAGLPVIEG